MGCLLKLRWQPILIIHLFCVLLDISDSITYSTDLLSLIVGDRDSELLLFVKLASGFTSASSTPSLSTIIAFTLLSISDIIFFFKMLII